MSHHGKCYVYGARNPVVSTLFIVPWNDYIFRVGYDMDQLYIVENYEGAFQQIFANQKGCLYGLDSRTFQKNNKLWHGELVSEYQARVLDVVEYDNILNVLLDYVQKGQLCMYDYPNRPSFYPNDDDDLLIKAVKNIERFGECEKEKFLSAHPHLFRRLDLKRKGQKNKC